MANDAELNELATRLGEALQRRGCDLAVAESCTGGWIAKCLTDIAGSSAWFAGGFSCYSNHAKQAMLGVSDETLVTHGAVSEAVARELATAARHQLGTGLSVAVTGIAGPSGGTVNKPVGLVWFAWTGRDDEVVTARHVFDGDREAVRRQTVAVALEGVVARLGPAQATGSASGNP
jgi:nicotinamide-nucleotide amidase